MKYVCLILCFFCLFSLSCTKQEELSLEQLEALNAEGLAELLAKTVSKPLQGRKIYSRESRRNMARGNV